MWRSVHPKARRAQAQAFRIRVRRNRKSVPVAAARIFQFPGFDVPVREGQSESSIMTSGRRVEKTAAFHIDHEPAFVDALLMFVDKNGGVRWRGGDDVRFLSENSKAVQALKRFSAHPT